jgi:hypothetical protein
LITIAIAIAIDDEDDVVAAVVAAVIVFYQSNVATVLSKRDCSAANTI